MRRSLLLACAAGLILVTTAAAQTPPPLTMPPPVQTMPGGPDYDAVLASPIRTDEDRARDEARMAIHTVRFTHVQPGWKVADMIMGGGYFTRIFSAAVGPEGRVTAWQPAEFIAFQASYGDAADAADALPNVDVIRSPIAAPEFPQGLDLIFTAQNYHDLHLRPFEPNGTAAKVNAAAFAALKPGGWYVIVDHYAVDGSPLSVAHDLHRIDRSTVVREVEAAGFEYRSESGALWRDEDPRNANVFDPSIRGRTSQFMIAFQKPE